MVGHQAQFVLHDCRGQVHVRGERVQIRQRPDVNIVDKCREILLDALVDHLLRPTKRGKVGGVNDNYKALKFVRTSSLQHTSGHNTTLAHLELMGVGEFKITGRFLSAVGIAEHNLHLCNPRPGICESAV